MQPEPKVNILLIDDQPKNLQTMEVKVIRESLAQNLLKAHSSNVGSIAGTGLGITVVEKCLKLHEAKFH